MKMQNFRKKISQWYKTHPVNFPWRATNSAYCILVSEVMLQQTQIPRVLMKYPLFLKRFPTTKSLARANLSSVLLAWHGMGYNRRAQYLKKAAEEVERQYGGKLPENEAELRALPGIGPYTARAIRCFAFGICEPFIETNIRRVIIHEFFPSEDNVPDSNIVEVLEKAQPKQNAREWYYALMDYGRDALRGTPNANRRSKHYAKQTRFAGSTRYVRSLMVQYVLKHKKASSDELFGHITENRHAAEFSQEDLERILTTLIRDKIIKKSQQHLRIG